LLKGEQISLGKRRLTLERRLEKKINLPKKHGRDMHPVLRRGLKNR
jgi:hypothetical protein